MNERLTSDMASLVIASVIGSCVRRQTESMVNVPMNSNTTFGIVFELDGCKKYTGHGVQPVSATVVALPSAPPHSSFESDLYVVRDCNHLGFVKIPPLSPSSIQPNTLSWI